MHIPSKQRHDVYMALFQDGVFLAKKDFFGKHYIMPINNLFVIKIMQSLKSRNYVTENFNWQWFYWYLTNDGINYLRNYLNIPDDVMPNTLKKPTRRLDRPERGERGDRDRGDRDRGEGRGYRRPYGAPGSDRFGDKKPGATPDFAPTYRGATGMGMGRGRGMGAPRTPGMGMGRGAAPPPPADKS
ncbi:40S ribosomal protein S10-1 [Pelomyxa schiedti]|nr:40S ribosomal protein S10-1 [Pelomyxa schiedti]